MAPMLERLVKRQPHQRQPAQIRRLSRVRFAFFGLCASRKHQQTRTAAQVWRRVKTFDIWPILEIESSGIEGSGQPMRSTHPSSRVQRRHTGYLEVLVIDSVPLDHCARNGVTGYEQDLGLPQGS